MQHSRPKLRRKNVQRQNSSKCARNVQQQTTGDSAYLGLRKVFRKNGALFVPAHLHQSKDPENSRSIDDVYDDDTFLGFIEDGASIVGGSFGSHACAISRCIGLI
jgi:hypothetical protein